MAPTQLDSIFPFIVLFYGILVLFVLELKPFAALANQHMPAWFQNVQQRRGLAFICVIVGGLWALQNLFFV